VERNIDALASQPWAAPTYHQIMDLQIESATELSEADDKPALRLRLQRAYTDQILRCADSLLRGSCSPNHRDLNAMVDSLKLVHKLTPSYRDGDVKALLARKSSHDLMLSFSVSPSYPTGAWVRPYDSSYDSDRRSKAASYRAKNPTCTAIKQKIASSYVEEMLSRRRQRYNQLVQAHAYDEAR
jgi:hypothetical protein